MANRKFLIILSVASGIGAAALGQVYLSRLEEEVAGGPRLQLVSTVRDLPLGAVISKADLALQQVPSSYVTRRQVRASDTEKLIGVRTNAALKGGDLVQWTDVAGGQEAARSLAGLVQKGMRALNIASEQLFDGLLRPGDRVDLLYTSHSGAETATLLQNLLVLAVNGTTEVAAEVRSGGGNGSVVVSMTVEQAQTVTQAEQGGTLRLSLRNADDITLVDKLPSTTQGDVQQAKERTDWVVAVKKKPEVPVIERVQ